MATLIPSITVIDKILMFALGCVVALISLVSLQSHIVYKDYLALESEVRAGRRVSEDIDRLKSYLALRRNETLPCNMAVRTNRAVLQLYDSDLRAWQQGLSDFTTTGNLLLQVARTSSLRRVREVLECSPLDGDMWLRMAIMGFSLQMDRQRVTTFLDWSRLVAPNEMWIKYQRQQFAVRYNL